MKAWTTCGSSSKVFVSPPSQNAKEKIDGCVLLELDAIADAIGGVHQHPDTQGQIRLLTKIANFLRKFFVKNLEVFFLQIGDQLVAAVQDGKQDVHQVDDLDDALLSLRGRWFFALLRRLALRRRRGWRSLRLRRGARRRLLRAVAYGRRKQNGDEEKRNLCPGHVS